MTARELMEWEAYERVYGSILPHERIDIGFAQVCYYLVALLGQRKGQRLKLEPFLPKWLRDLRRARSQDPSRLEAMFQFLASVDGGAPSQPLAH